MMPLSPTRSDTPITYHERGGEDEAVILFDGHCSLCHSFVAFVSRRDRRSFFRTEPIESSFGQSFIEKHAVTVPTASSQCDSFILYDEGRIYVRSDAALRVTRRLGGLWPLAYAFIVIPKSWRDTVYCFVSNNRHRWRQQSGQS